MLAFLRETPPSTRGAVDFLPGPLRLVESPPSPAPRRLLYWVTALFAIALLWLVFGRVDIVAVAVGKLAPRTSIKIVQPADAGRVAEIAVAEGDAVVAGQVLLRLDAELHDSDTRALRSDLVFRTLQLRRIDAELADAPLRRFDGDAEESFVRMESQHRANRLAYADALAQDRAAVARIGQELRAATAVLVKLERTVPIYRTVADRYATLKAEGFVSELAALERQRDRIEKEQDEDAQKHTVESIEANLAQAQRRLAQVESSYRQQLHTERTQVASQRTRTEEDLAKALYRAAAVELRAPQAGVVKDLGTHTIGTVVSPGAVLLTLVPAGEELQADVMVRNLDVGFVHVGQSVKVKVATYPFQKYGTVEGVVTHISADASEAPPRRDVSDDAGAQAQSGYRARVALASQSVAFDGRSLLLASGMQVETEIRLGERSLLEYVLAPFQKAWHEAARER